LLDNPLPLGKIAEAIPEFKPACESQKVFLEKMLGLGNIRLIFVTGKVSDLSKHIGSAFVDRDKDINDWSLSYKVYLCDGESENISSNSMVREIVVAVDGEYRIGKTAHAFGTKLVKNPIQ
jgi:predicted NUDIX family NTP pyrophosphohydrolase